MCQYSGYTTRYSARKKASIKKIKIFILLLHYIIICVLYSYILGFPGGSAGQESTCNVGDLGSMPGLGRSPGEGKGYPLQYSGLENFMDFMARGLTESDTTEQLSHTL